MNIKTWREGREYLVKDSLLACAARLGFMSVEKLNALPTIQGVDGNDVKITAIPGPVGSRIRALMDVSITNPERTNVTRFVIDVIGDAQCRNCTFLEHISVNQMSADEFDYFCMLPEIFADVVAGELCDHYIRNEDESYSI